MQFLALLAFAILILPWILIFILFSRVSKLENKLGQIERVVNSARRESEPIEKKALETRGDATALYRPPVLSDSPAQLEPVDEKPADTPIKTAPSLPKVAPPSAQASSSSAKLDANEQIERRIPPASVAASRPSPAFPERPRSIKPPTPSFVERLFQVAKAWLFGGNTVVRVGMVVLFLGLAFLLRLTSQYISFPTEIRYISVAAAAFALLAFGWRLRLNKPMYGLLLQGGGIGVLYLTSFAALRLAEPALLPSGWAFGLMVLVTVAAVALALLQDSIALACAAALGAFAAPILASSGSGDHVALFSYFALLNTGIALVAWFKAWRTLNLIGFFGTFSIGMAWGLRDNGYTAEKFASTEPFLVLFFLMFVLIGMLFARRKLIALPKDNKDFVLSARSSVSTDYIDGTLVFGPPLIGFALQCAIISHIEFGAAYSALALGLFYIALAYCMRGRKAISLMMEVCLALGVVFGTLAIPLAWGAQLWTSAAWALEAAGIYWVGHVQGRKLARLFALAVLALASLLFLNGLEFGTGALLDGSPLGAALLGLAWFFCCYTLRRAKDGSKQLLPVLEVAGLFFLYLIAPLSFGRENTVIAWALASTVTIFLGTSLGSRAFIACAFVVQTCAALLFVPGIEFGNEMVLDAGWKGAFIAFLLGLALIANVFFAFNRKQLEEGQTESGKGESASLMSSRMNKAALTFSIAFFSMTFAFILDWNNIGVAWAGLGVLLVCLGLWRQSSVLLFFGLMLELIAGCAFLLNRATEFVPPNGWISAVIALAAFIGAWRLNHVAQRLMTPGSRENTVRDSKAFHPDRIAASSNALLIWGVGWWIGCAIERIESYSWLFASTEILYLSVIVLTAIVWMIVSRLARWRQLALFCLLLVEVSGLALLKIGFDMSLLSTTEWVAYFTMHFVALGCLSGTLSTQIQKVAHVLGAWLLVFFLTLVTNYAVHSFAPYTESAWRWLGWALASSLYLWLMASERMRFWPLGAFSRQYRFQAAVPMMIALLGWFWLANLYSSGNPAPLPYLPLVNPLELGLLIVLLGCVRWGRFHLPNYSMSPASVKRDINIVAMVSLFALLTQAVSRAGHAFGGIEFNHDALMNSMGVQAGWSIVWTLFALTLMIGGSIRKYRNVWMAGAALSGIVVVKLFLVDLGNNEDISRVISFIGVGVLLLIVGYFAPLPPKTNSSKAMAKGVSA
jgi:uncharacterized membrane protein